MGRPEPSHSALATAAKERVGEVLDGRYRLEEVVGVGGLGIVYRAEHTGLRRFVALKLMHEVFADHDELRQRFEREARALSSLEHPNIVAITDFGTHEGAPYLAMALIEGESLSERLSRGPLPVSEAIDVTRQVLEALISAHASGVVHRDLKPGNIMLEPLDGGELRVRIVDFGLAKMVDPGGSSATDATLTRLGTVIGSPSYMAPEQTTAEPADERADLYALGIILYEMLVGRCPFVNEDKLDTVRSHLTQEVPRPESFRPGLALTPELDSLLFKSLAKSRDARFGSAREMHDALSLLPDPAAAAPGDALPARGSASIAPKAAISRSGPNPALLLVLAAVGLGGAVVIGLGLVAVVSYLSMGGEEEAIVDSPMEIAPTDDSMMVFDEDELPPPGSRPAPSDPLAGGVPVELEVAHAIVLAGVALDREQQRELIDHQGAHLDDPRPSLILAHDYANQRWYGDAIPRYERVHRIDPSARGNEWMSQDLMTMIAAPSHGVRAMQAVRRIYGAEAIPFVEARLGEPGVERVERQRLEQLLRRLR